MVLPAGVLHMSGKYYSLVSHQCCENHLILTAREIRNTHKCANGVGTPRAIQARRTDPSTLINVTADESITCIQPGTTTQAGTTVRQPDRRRAAGATAITLFKPDRAIVYPVLEKPGGAPCGLLDAALYCSCGESLCMNFVHDVRVASCTRHNLMGTQRHEGYHT